MVLSIHLGRAKTMHHIVTKFGGTSVSTRANWNHIAEITKKHIQAGAQPIIVCSALTQISNKLEKAVDAALSGNHQPVFEDIKNSHIALAKDLEVSPQLINAELEQLQQWLTGIALLKQAPAKTRAQVMSLGELMMTRFGHAFLTQQGINNQWHDARSFLISTPVYGAETENYLTARCETFYDAATAETLLGNGAQAIITQGFFAANPQGETVLLGRGGSDTSAALIACKVQAACCEIWTDVPGIYTANPHQLPEARLLKQLNYDEAQEIASMGAKVLHPNCIPPVRKANIPMVVKYTQMPEHSGTLITRDLDETAPLIKSIQVKHSIILISIDTLNMWQQVGFLADVFTVFKQHGFSVDLLSSSEFNVTLSLDNNGKLYDRAAINHLLEGLSEFGKARLIEPCSQVSLVGHHIRTVLPKIGPVMEVFDDKQVYLMSLASNDLNMAFVVNESQAAKLTQELHHLLIEKNPQIYYYSKSWHEEFGKQQERTTPWWEQERDALLTQAHSASPCYVYHKPTLTQKAQELLKLQSVSNVFYALKANPHRDILKTLEPLGIGFECVSIQEVALVLELFPKIDKQRILFTPNFAPKAEYEQAMALGCPITIDSLYPLEQWPDLFKNREVSLRIDPGTGAGHHKHVSTGGNESKFGINQNDLPRVLDLIAQHQIQVIGLHSHSGSGILTPTLWEQTALMLASLAQQFPKVKSINLGGGLGVVERPGQQPMDFEQLDSLLTAVKSSYPHLELRLEPGRYFVSECGVLLARVTQCKTKERVRFVGVETGMNSLIRPALYGAYHEIVNLSRLHDEKTGFAHVVGPICESADTLGYDRLLPDTVEGDIMLLANAGAYGHCMSSSYNLRPAAQEVVLD